jgi:two-component sensor histidine kinase
LWITDPSDSYGASRIDGVGADAVTNDLSYYRVRASEERTAALNARDPRVRRVHVDMAERYENRVRGMAAHHEELYVPMVEVA